MSCPDERFQQFLFYFRSAISANFYFCIKIGLIFKPNLYVSESSHVFIFQSPASALVCRNTKAFIFFCHLFQSSSNLRPNPETAAYYFLKLQLILKVITEFNIMLDVFHYWHDSLTPLWFREIIELQQGL